MTEARNSPPNADEFKLVHVDVRWLLVVASGGGKTGVPHRRKSYRADLWNPFGLGIWEARVFVFVVFEHSPIAMFAPKTSAPSAGGLTINTNSTNSLLLVTAPSP